MTDAEIKKALEHCFDNTNCYGCPLQFDETECSYFEPRKQALNLINRQQAEIERLKSEAVNVECTEEELKSQEQVVNVLNYIKAEAIKEFAEEYLKQLPYEEYDEVYIKTIRDDIVFLAKEKGVVIGQ